MIYANKQSGFTTVELLVTLFVAAAFLIAGYQLFNIIIKDGGSARFQSIANNKAYDYLQQYKTKVAANTSCNNPTNYSLNTASISVAGISNVTVKVDITCPYSAITALSKITVTLKYGNPQQTIINSTYATK